MNCRRTQRLLSRSIDRDLSAGEAGAVLAHLNSCRTCDRYHAALRKLGVELRQLPRPSGPRDLRREVTQRWAVEHAAIQAGRRDRPRGLTAGRSISWATVGLSAMLLLLRFAHVIPVQRDRDGKMASARPGVSQRLHGGPPMPGTQSASRRGVYSAVGEGALLSRDLTSLTTSGVGGNKQPGSPKSRVTKRHADLPRSAAGPSPDDLAFLNGNPLADVRRGALVTPAGRATRRTTLLRGVPVRDDFVRVPLPRLADADGTLIAPAMESYQREAAVVDVRLFRKVTLGVKATALTDLCEQLRAETGIHLVAGRSVADEKVTVFCKETPLREVMRQLSRPFGYAWLRSGKAGEYQYELVQDLRSQLLEEELRNRDRNAALLALDTEMQRYRKYLGLSPDEALARARTASPEEKKLLERYSGAGWGPAQLYFRLSPNDLSQMRAGNQVTFAAERSRAWQPDHQPLPAELARGTLQTERTARIIERDGRLALGGSNDPEGLPPARVPAARAMVRLRIEQSELGQFTFGGMSGCFISESVQPSGSFYMFTGDENLAVGISPSVLNPRNEETNAKLAHDPSLQARVTVTPQPACGVNPSPGPSPKRGGVPDARDGMSSPKGPQRHDSGDTEDKLPLSASGRRGSRVLAAQRTAAGAGPRVGGGVNEVTTADMLEALHRATGRPIVADFYTRLYPLAEATAQNLPLFDALNRLADGMRLRWQKESEWLQFRSASYFHDRLKEVPNRLLERWSASRRQHGALTLDDLIEIAQLSDAQLDAAGMAEGAELCYGLAEWKLPRVQWLREQLHYLAEFTPAQREEAQRPAGLAFPKMTLRQQQAYLAHSWANVGLDEMASWTLRVQYMLPGEFQWVLPGWRQYLPSRVRERTQMAALQAARRIDPDVTEAQIVPTQLDLAICYAPAGENPPRARVARRGSNGMAP